MGAHPMKRFIGFILLICSLTALADNNSLVIRQRKIDDSGNDDQVLANPLTPGILIFDTTKARPGPGYLTLGTGLTASSGILALTAQPVNADWASTGGLSQILNKPTIPAAQVNADWAASSGISSIMNKPALFSGAYVDLTGKPALFSGAYVDLTGKPTLFSGAFSALTGIPTTRAGYGITDALGASDLVPYVLTSTYTSGLATKFNAPAGTTAQYLRGDGTAATFPTLFSGSYVDLSNKPTTLSGYGITDGYSTSNPASYISQAGARTSISLTTTGSGAATYNSSTGVLNVPTPAAGGTTAITGVTAKTGSYRVYQSFTITTAGTAVFQLTADGTSTGTALFANETFTDSVQPIVNDATASYQFGWAFSNSNKTLTVTVNKLTTANLLTGVLGQAAAPAGTVVKLVVEGR